MTFVYCDFIDERSDFTIECSKEGIINMLGILGYSKCCPKHAKYIRQLVKHDRICKIHNIKKNSIGGTFVCGECFILEVINK